MSDTQPSPDQNLDANSTPNPKADVPADGGTTAPAAKPEGDTTTDWKAEARKHEQRAKANAAAAKELAELKTAAAERDAARAELALERAARKHGLSDDDLELLDGVPADQIEARAAKLAARIGAATPAAKPGPKPNPQQGNPSRSRGGTLAAGRARHAERHGTN